MRTCRNDLSTYCGLSDQWNMNNDKDDTQIGIYLSCLYQQRQMVCAKSRTTLEALFSYTYSI